MKYLSQSVKSCLVAFVILFGIGASQSAHSALRPIYNYWNADTGDARLVSHPTSIRRAEAQGYVRFQQEGCVETDGANNPGMDPLLLHWSGREQDSYTGRAEFLGMYGSYEVVRLEGYVYNSDPNIQRIALWSYYNRRGDRYTTTGYGDHYGFGDENARRDGYSSLFPEGYLMPWYMCSEN